MYVCTTGLGARDPRAAAPAALAPGTAISSRAVGEHGTAIMLARGEFGSSADIESDTRSLWPAVDTLLDAAAGAALLRDATAGGVASVLNELARASGVADGGREADVPVSPPWPAPASCWGSTDVCGQRGQARGLRRAGRGGAALAACAASRLRGGRGDRRGEDRPARDGAGRDGVWRQRVMDQLVGDPLPRIC
jgi:hydrogenase expression/formation protein HypE